MRRGGMMVENISIWRGWRRSQPGFAFAFAMLMFSLAGIPPLAGFFAKFYVFLAAINSGLYPLAVIGVLASVVGAFYYLRIVKLIYFDEPAPAFDKDIRGRSWRCSSRRQRCSRLFFVVGAAPLVISAATAPPRRCFRDRRLRAWPEGSASHVRRDSTNEEARRLARAGEQGRSGSSPLAQRRRARPARQRAWVSEPGNLFATLLLPAASARAASWASRLVWRRRSPSPQWHPPPRW